MSAPATDTASCEPVGAEVAAPTAAAASTRGPAPADAAVATRRARIRSGEVASPDAFTSAAAPATTGDAIEVPDDQPWDDPGIVESNHQPGAQIVTDGPWFEKLADVSVFVDAATAMTLS